VRVEIQDHTLGTSARCPRPRTDSGARVTQPVKHVFVDELDRPPRRRTRRDRPEQLRLIAQHAEIRDAITAVGEHHRQVGQHPAPIMSAGALACARQRRGELARDPQPMRQPGNQRGPRTRHQPIAVRSDFYRYNAAIGLHHLGDPPEQSLRASTTRILPAQEDIPTASATPDAALPKDPGNETCRASHYGTSIGMRSQAPRTLPACIGTTPVPLDCVDAGASSVASALRRSGSVAASCSCCRGSACVAADCARDCRP